MRFQNRPLNKYLVISSFEYNKTPNSRRELIINKLYDKLKYVEDDIDNLNNELDNELSLLIKLYKSGSNKRKQLETRIKSDNLKLEIKDLLERKQNILECIKDNI